MARLAIEPAAEQEKVEVDLWGTVFVRVPVTRSRQRKLAEVEKRLGAVDENAKDADDKAVQLMGEMLDQVLAPVEGDAVPSALIVEKWKADVLTFDRLSAFLGELTEATADPT